ncbi:hypothetical protein EVAR_67274_1 [Eumeta japonica]|uniref:Uncharacterized protein n=1 Tax=Eumeta variegata TaxID=151549 RepID=A0A4C1ZVN3_EUMVA|nr:hypothetical protein EVAR_67274_1 [Eumeta japonica]
MRFSLMAIDQYVYRLLSFNLVRSEGRTLYVAHKSSLHYRYRPASYREKKSRSVYFGNVKVVFAYANKIFQLLHRIVSERRAPQKGRADAVSGRRDTIWEPAIRVPYEYKHQNRHGISISGSKEGASAARVASMVKYKQNELLDGNTNDEHTGEHILS